MPRLRRIGGILSGPWHSGRYHAFPIVLTGRRFRAIQTKETMVASPRLAEGGSGAKTASIRASKLYTPGDPVTRVPLPVSSASMNGFRLAHLRASEEFRAGQGGANP